MCRPRQPPEWDYREEMPEDAPARSKAAVAGAIFVLLVVAVVLVTYWRTGRQ